MVLRAGAARVGAGLPGRTVVACVGPRVLGMAHMGPNRPGPGSHVATASFMDAADAPGGRARPASTPAWVREQEYAAMRFNAVVEKPSATVRLQ